MIASLSRTTIVLRIVHVPSQVGQAGLCRPCIPQTGESPLKTVCKFCPWIPCHGYTLQVQTQQNLFFYILKSSFCMTTFQYFQYFSSGHPFSLQKKHKRRQTPTEKRRPRPRPCVDPRGEANVASGPHQAKRRSGAPRGARSARRTAWFGGGAECVVRSCLGWVLVTDWLGEGTRREGVEVEEGGDDVPS